jgi:hypothetical protein
MSINTTPDDLKDTNCEKGHVAQWPPIPYVLVTSTLKTSTLMESIKVKLNMAGNLIRLGIFEDGDTKKYLKHLMIHQHLQATKGVEERLLLLTRELGDKNKILKVLCRIRTRETCKAKELCLLEVSKAEFHFIEQQSLMKCVADAACGLLCQIVCGEAQTQWDRIVKDKH